MNPPLLSSPIGVLLSGGLDSSILVAHLLDQGRSVQPFFIRGGLFWEREEAAAIASFLEAVRSPALAPLVELQLPLADLYRDHWSMTGRGIPSAETPDEAVFLPGRNALLVVKAAIWCQLHGIPQLALAPLVSNPFPDASDPFFQHLQAALSYTGAVVEIVRPFGQWHKRQVMHLGRSLPLERTFSCISPVAGRHCGGCNKCAERQEAFRAAELVDRTPYAGRRSAGSV